MMTAEQFRKALARLGRRPQWERHRGEQENVATQDRGSITDPANMTAEDRRDYVDTFPQVDHFDCVHGHGDCAIKCDGVCIDELLRYMTQQGEIEK